MVSSFLSLTLFLQHCGHPPLLYSLSLFHNCLLLNRLSPRNTNAHWDNHQLFALVCFWVPSSGHLVPLHPTCSRGKMSLCWTVMADKCCFHPLFCPTWSCLISHNSAQLFWPEVLRCKHATPIINLSWSETVFFMAGTSAQLIPSPITECFYKYEASWLQDWKLCVMASQCLMAAIPV